jgi:cell division protein ZapA
MTNKPINTTIQILGKSYSIKTTETLLHSLQAAAVYLDQQMSLVKESGKAINLERIAIITALNLAHQFLQLDQQKNSLINKINQRILQIQDKLEETLSPEQNELVYISE